MINKDRLKGDQLYFMKGVDSLLTPCSIYSRLKEDRGVIFPTYSECIKSLSGHPDSFRFKDYAESVGYYEPCISTVLKVGLNKWHVVFSRVDTEQLPYDLRCVRLLIPKDALLSVEIKEIKDFKRIKK